MRAASCCLLALAMWVTAIGATHAQSTRFRSSAHAHLAPSPAKQKNSRFTLGAQLDAQQGAPVFQPVRQTSARFALTATVSASSLVCYNDTIFRDGFDGTGL